EIYLTPGFNDYDAYLRYHTYDITNMLYEDSDNTFSAELGDGWYKGRIGIDKPEERGGNVFGSRYYLAARLHIVFKDGHTEDILTDESFTAARSFCTENSIYDGETRDYTVDKGKSVPCVFADVSYNLLPEFGAPIKERAVLKPRLYISPSGAKILDFKQNMVGFVRFSAKLSCGTRVTLSHGEILQDGEFYSGNLRTARARAVYVSDGEERVYEPYFTFFGFRYVLVEGMEKVDPEMFEGVVIHSALPAVSHCVTDNKKINRLIENAKWGQKGNFLDVPTDCPQRDERLGWTADTQVFLNTACYNMDCYPFYKKYMRDLRADQTMYYAGDIPMYSPSLRREAGNGGAVWADAGTIIPWNLYMFYGDKSLLSENYDMMRDYTETLILRDAEQGGRDLILYGFTFGDWLAQDGVCPQSLSGGTDNGFIMSVYYYNSVRLTAMTAKELGNEADAERYFKKAERIYSAILDEFFAPGGKIALDTQTSYVLSLYYGIYRDKARVIADFRERLAKDFYRMKTGFTGTPLILPAMFENGMDDDAYRILYNEECPGWLYAVNLGATTIWERWNSLLPDGRISGTNMNSLNHYAYGSVCEAIYAYIAGLRVDMAGWGSAVIEPHINYRMKDMSFSFDSQRGEYKVEWHISEGTFRMSVKIPAGCTARIILPDGTEYQRGMGEHFFSIPAPESVIHPFTLDTPNIDILANKEAHEAMKQLLPQAYAMVCGENEEFKIKNGRFLGMLPMFGASKEAMAEYEKRLRIISF
ncbi:MAG: family 78 glycoside hydrolase catalytic domain, partial [Eubacteriales bacterium]